MEIQITKPPDIEKMPKEFREAMVGVTVKAEWFPDKIRLMDDGLNLIERWDAGIGRCMVKVEDLIAALRKKSSEAAGWLREQVPADTIFPSSIALGCITLGCNEIKIIPELNREIITRRVGHSAAPRFSLDAGAECTQIASVNIRTGEKIILFTGANFSEEKYRAEGGAAEEETHFNHLKIPQS